MFIDNIKPEFLGSYRGKTLFYLLGMTCILLMAITTYDTEFHFAIILPLCFIGCLFVFLKNNTLSYGMCTIALVGFYSFRMCIQPLILAQGNFWLETDRTIYLPYFNYAIILTCLECIIVFYSLRYYVQFYRRRKVVLCKKDLFDKHSVYKWIVLSLSIVIFLLIKIYNIKYFYFFLDELELDKLIDREDEIVRNKWYFIVDLLAGWWRPLLSFWIIYKAYIKYKNKSFWIIILVAILNLSFTSDRRIFSIIVGGYCLYFLLGYIRGKFFHRMAISLLCGAILGVIIILFSGYNEQGGKEIISRTVNRYFSGPTLTAMNLQMIDAGGLQTLDFFKLLFNDFQILTGIFGAYIVPSDYMKYYGMSKGLWTPATVGAIKYFGFLFPLFNFYFTKFVISMDYNSNTTPCILYKLVYSYLGIVMACYMIMYTLELIVYFLLSTALLFKLLINMDRKYSIVGLKNKCSIRSITCLK